MDSLIADCVQFYNAIFKFLFVQGRLDYVCTQFRHFNKTSSFCKLFDSSWRNW